MQPQYSNRLSFSEQLEIARGLTKLPALTVMVFLRRDIGCRLLSPFQLLAVNGILMFVADLFDESDQDANWVDLFMFALAALLLGLCLRAIRWDDYRRGLIKHSYYIGSSIFELLPLPKCLRRHRIIPRFADPLACGFIGYHILPDSPILGHWLIFSGICLHVFEEHVRRKALHQSMDVADSLVEAQVHMQRVEHFESPQETPKQKPSIAVPTGLGADILPQIKRRKWTSFFRRIFTSHL